MKEIREKKRRIWMFAAVILILSLVFVMLMDSLDMGRLPREKDTEFDKGSKIQSQELSDIQVDSLYKLCKVWGYTKYYHPAV